MPRECAPRGRKLVGDDGDDSLPWRATTTLPTFSCLQYPTYRAQHAVRVGVNDHRN